MCEQKYETETEQDNDGDEKSNIVNKKQDERSKVWFVWVKESHAGIHSERRSSWMKKDRKIEKKGNKSRRTVTAAERQMVVN